MIWLLIIPLALLGIYFLIGAIRARMKWDDEKEAHRRHGGRAPRK